MAELPAELIHAILVNMTDHISLINLALTSRLYYTTAMPVILAEESRYVREVMMPGKHLSLYELPYSRSRLPPARLDSPAGPFTGTFRKISFTPWQDSKYMCCIRRIVRRVNDLERISMNVLGGELQSWITAYMNICVGRPGVEFVLHGGTGEIPIVIDEEPPSDIGLEPKPMRKPSLPFNHPLRLPAASSTITKKRDNLSSKFVRQLKLTRTHTLDHPQLGSRSNSETEPLGLIPPQIFSLKLVNELLFSSSIATAVHALAAGKNITSFKLANVRAYSHKDIATHTRHDIGNILAALTFPSLTYLSLTRLTPPPRALMQFLARHPLITDLRLDLTSPAADAGITQSTISAITGGYIPASPPQRFMPNLVRLRGTAHWLLPFVRWRQLKKRGGGDAGHLPALEELELLTGTGAETPWERDELEAVYNALFCATNSSSTSSALPWKSSSYRSSKLSKLGLKHSIANTEAAIRIRNLIIGSLYSSHIIDWLMMEAAKRQAWPVIPDNAGVGIDKLTISEFQTFTMPVKTRTALWDGLQQWCPELAIEIEMDERERARLNGAGGDAGLDTETNAATETMTESHPWIDADTDPDAQPDTFQKDDFTQRLLKRVIWLTFPSLQTLQIGVDKTDYPPVQRLSRPVGL